MEHHKNSLKRWITENFFTLEHIKYVHIYISVYVLQIVVRLLVGVAIFSVHEELLSLWQLGEE